MWQEPKALDWNWQGFKSEKKWGFLVIDKTLPTLHEFYYSYFHKWKKLNNLNAYIKFGRNLFHWHERKKGNIIQVLSFVKEKLTLGSFRNLYYVSNGLPQLCLGLVLDHHLDSCKNTLQNSQYACFFHKPLHKCRDKL